VPTLNLHAKKKVREKREERRGVGCGWEGGPLLAWRQKKTKKNEGAGTNKKGTEKNSVL
jgi:hypothetical protein